MMDYFLSYISENFGKRPSANEGERSELEFLRKTVGLIGGQGAMSPGVSTGDSDKQAADSSESSGEED